MQQKKTIKVRKEFEQQELNRIHWVKLAVVLEFQKEVDFHRMHSQAAKPLRLVPRFCGCQKLAQIHRLTEGHKHTLILLLTSLIARPSTVATKVNGGAKHADLYGLFKPGLCCHWQRSGRAPTNRATFLLKRRAQLPRSQQEALQIPLLGRGESSHRQLNPINDKIL